MSIPQIKIGFFGLFACCTTGFVGCIIGDSLATSKGWHRETATEVFTRWAQEQGMQIKEGSVLCAKSQGNRGVLCQFHEMGKEYLQRAFCPGWPNLLGEDTCELGTKASALDIYE